MDTSSIGKIKKVPLREIWKKEDRDFTCWLEENIDYLNEQLDMDINIISREEKVGPFRLDLYGEDGNGRKVIIENQLEKTDHDHLGKVITYLTNLDAQTAIWITSKPTEEHTRAIEWMNEISPETTSFYLVKLEAISIEGQSKSAPLFTVTAGPTEELKQIGEEKKQLAKRHTQRLEFWKQLLEKAAQKTKLHTNVSPCIYHWIGAGSGKTGISFNYALTNSRGSVEVYLDRGKQFVEPNLNKIRFDKLFKHKNEIEKEFGEALSWERLDERRASRIAFYFQGAGLKDEDKWDVLQDKMADAMSRLEKASKKYIKELG